MTSKWRIVAGVAILAILVASIVMLAPSYYRNLRLGQSMERLVAQEGITDRADSALRTQVVSAAREVGVPLRDDQVKVDRTGGKLRLEVRYIVRVDVPIYTVDLHFRADSGAR